MKLMSGLVLIFVAHSAAAQEADWRHKATFYGWFPGLTASVDTKFGTVEGEVCAGGTHGVGLSVGVRAAWRFWRTDQTTPTIERIAPMRVSAWVGSRDPRETRTPPTRVRTWRTRPRRMAGFMGLPFGYVGLSPV